MTYERRYAHCHGLKGPLVFCTMDSPLSKGHQTKSINISWRGVHHVTSHQVFARLPVQVLLRMPKWITETLPTGKTFDGWASHFGRGGVPKCVHYHYAQMGH